MVVMVSFPQAEQAKSLLTEKALSLPSCMVLLCSTVLFPWALGCRIHFVRVFGLKSIYHQKSLSTTEGASVQGRGGLVLCSHLFFQKLYLESQSAEMIVLNNRSNRV